MTLESAIKRYEAGVNIYSGCEQKRSEEYAELVRFLTELQERRAEDKADLERYNRNRPLTPYEMMGMDGQEVYVVSLWECGQNTYATVDVVNMSVIWFDEYKFLNILSFAPNIEDRRIKYYHDWLAFRKKPEDEGVFDARRRLG